MTDNVNISASPLDAANLTTEVSGAQQTMETPTTGPIVKGPTVKGGISVPGNVALNPTQTAELLANMQAMIDKRTGGWNEFMSGMQDTLALATPQRLGGPTQAMAQRAATKRQEQEDVFNMRAQVASLKAGQAQAANQRAIAEQILGGGGGQGGGAGGAPQSVFGGGIEIPQEIRAAYALDPVNGTAMLNKYLASAGVERNKAKLNPAWGALTEVIGNTGQIEKVPLWQAVDIAMQNPNNPKNRAVIQTAQETPGTPPGLSAAAAGAPKGDAEGVARSLGVPLTSGTRSYDKQASMYAESQKPGYTGPVVAKPDTSRHVTGNAVDVDMKRATPEQLQALRDAGFKQTVKSEPWHWELTTAAPTQVAAAPTTIRTDVGGGSMPPRAQPGESADSLKKRTEIWQKTQEKQAETDIATRAKSGEEISKKSGDMIAGIVNEARKAPEVIKTAQHIIDHATSRPKEFGYAYQQENKPLAMAANIPGVGAIVEKTAPALFGSPGESDRRTKTDTDANKLGLDFASQMFAGTGARLGVGLEQMAANAKGVGTQFPASTNALNANLVKVAAQKAQDIAKLWDKWAPQNGGVNADGNRFVQTPEYQKLEEEWDKRLIDFDKEMAKKFPDVYQPYAKPNRKPLNDIFGAKP